VVCLGESSEALASGTDFLWAPLEVLCAYIFLVLLKNVLFTHSMYYKEDYK